MTACRYRSKKFISIRCGAAFGRFYAHESQADWFRELAELIQPPQELDAYARELPLSFPAGQAFGFSSLKVSLTKRRAKKAPNPVGKNQFLLSLYDPGASQ